MSDDNPEDPVAVADPEEYSQSRRLRAIHNARENVLDTRNNILEAQLSNGFSDQLARRYFRQAVENYILEVEPLLTSGDVECAPAYWENEYLGSFTVHPPAELTQRPDDPHTHIVGSDSIPEPETVGLYGLKDLIERTWPHTETFTLRINAKHDGIRSLSRTVSAEPSMDVLLSAFRQTNGFLQEIEIDATLNTNEDAGFEYDDLLESGPPASDPAGEPREQPTAEGDD